MGRGSSIGGGTTKIEAEGGRGGGEMGGYEDISREKRGHMGGGEAIGGEASW